MSQAEMERDDQEVIGIVNGHAHPEAAAAAEEIAAAVTEPVEEKTDFSTSGCRPAVEMTEGGCEPNGADMDAKFRKDEDLYRKKKRIEALKTVLLVAACLVIAAALVAAYYVPKLLIWVVNVGVLACGIAIALKIDKYIRWWR